MNIKPRIVCIILAVLIMLSALTGCRLEHYTRDDIVWWADEYIGNDVVVSDESFIRESGWEDYDDQVWTAYRESLPEVEFEIISHKFYGGESINVSIETTYWYEYGKYYFEQYQTEFGTDLVHLDEGWNTGAYRLLAVFSDREELSDVVAQATAIEEYMYLLGGVDFVSFRFEYDDILAQVGETDVMDLCTGFGALDDVEEALLRDLAFYAADYQLIPDMFTKEEIEQAVAHFDRRFAVTRADGSEVSYSDLTLNRFGYGMSFGTLYEVLSREGFAVNGTPEAFTVTGVDGSVYEFSYSFNDMPFDNGKNGYYYIKDGEKIAMQYYFYKHIKSDLFEEISGMTFREIRR